MKNVRKVDGRVEDFNRAKVQQSILGACGDEKLAVEVANAIPEEVSLTTADIRARVTEELRKRNPEVTERYERTRRLTASKSIDAAQGIAQVTEQAMNVMNLRPGDPVQLTFADNRHNVRAKRGTHDPRTIQLHEEDLRKIGAEDGSRIAVRRHR